MVLLLLMMLGIVRLDTHSSEGLRVYVIYGQGLACHTTLYLLLLILIAIHSLEMVGSGCNDLLTISEALSDLGIGATTQTLILYRVL